MTATRTVIQLCPAHPGWRLLYAFGGEPYYYFEDIAAWALVEVEDEDFSSRDIAPVAGCERGVGVKDPDDYLTVVPPSWAEEDDPLRSWIEEAVEDGQKMAAKHLARMQRREQPMGGIRRVQSDQAL